MKKASIFLVFITLLFIAFTFGFFLGRRMTHSEITISSSPSPTQTDPTRSSAPTPPPSGMIDLNTATAQELAQLPGIGDVLAQRIIAHREINGPFTAVRELADVEGIGEKRIHEILDLITIGGTT